MLRSDLPAGRVTFLFTDIEGSTRFLTSEGERAYAERLGEHRRVLREVFDRHGGVEVDTQGDAFFVAFATARGALTAAEEAVGALNEGPLRVRVGVHTGTPIKTDEGYVGIDVHRAARIAAVGHGGQVLVSSDTASAVTDVPLIDLGDHRLKDLPTAERLFQLGEGSFPPLRSVSASNLPTPTTAFVGRKEEVIRLAGSLSDPGVRLLTVTGPGGIGKTRVALQAAEQERAAFPGGLWWVPLAPLRDPELIGSAIAEGLSIPQAGDVSLGEAIAAQFGGRRTLLFLDNAEHLLAEVAAQVSSILEASPSVTVLVTSRERLRLGAEHVFDVPLMAGGDADALFLARACEHGVELGGSDGVTALCERLDRLPLALQLAAGRLRLFSVEQLLDRLSARLDLSSGERDADPRQATLRNTIAWSHDLLSDEERDAFRNLAVFVGGCSIEAAEEVSDADPQALESLLDKGLVQRREREGGEPRFWMLESIRDFAAERLEASGELLELRARHAAWYRRLAEHAEAALRGGDPEEIHVSVLEAEIDNLRAAMSFGLEGADPDLVRSIVAALPMYWIMRGRYPEARTWLERALEIDAAQDDLRRRLLSGLATIAALQGDHPLAVKAADEAADLAARVGGVTDRLESLRTQARSAWMNEDRESAERLYEEAFRVAREVDNGVMTSSCRLNLASLANETGRHRRAQELLEENLPFVRARGQSRCEATTLALMGETKLRLGQPEDVSDPAAIGGTRAMQIDDEPLLAFCLDLVAASAASGGEGRRAATILGATEAARRAMGAEPDDDEVFIRKWAEDRLAELLDRDVVDAARDEGSRLDLRSTLVATTEA